MAREYGKALTKEMLQEWGIEEIYWDENINEWIIDRYWFKNNSKAKVHKNLKIQNAVCKHKFTTDKSYPIITFSVRQNVITLPLARVIYAWFKGPIEEKAVIDHRNNDPYNNHPDNLQKLSVGENLAKRFIDNPLSNRNQYTTRTYKNRKENPELYSLCEKMFDKGIDYDKAKIIVALFGEIKENEKMTVKEVAQKHQEAKIASEVALEQKIQKLEDELKEIWNVLINEINRLHEINRF